MALSCHVLGDDRRCQGVYRVVDVTGAGRAGFSGWLPRSHSCSSLRKLRGPRVWGTAREVQFLSAFNCGGPQLQLIVFVVS